MRRWMLAILAVASLLFASAPAEAGWRHWGHRHWGGYHWGHHWGWRNHWGWRRSWGYGGWGGYAYRPFVYSYPGVSWGGYGCAPVYYNSCYPPVYYQGCATDGYSGGDWVHATPLGQQPVFFANQQPLPPVLNNLLQGDLVGQVAARLAERRAASAVSAERVISAQGRQNARTYLAQGDQYFRNQEYHIAAQRYKSAASAAPDMAEAYWRIGHAYVASNRHELASGAYKRAIALDPEITRGVELAALYGEARLSQNSHLETLAAAALANAASSEPYFLLGVQLHFSGERDRAGKFFAQAAAFTGPAAQHLAAFGRLPELQPAPAAPPAAAPAPLVLVSTPAREL